MDRYIPATSEILFSSSSMTTTECPSERASFSRNYGRTSYISSLPSGVLMIAHPGARTTVPSIR
jgi:hypothetical protein